MSTDKEKGFTQIPHFLENKLMSYRAMSSDERGVFDVIVRKTLGYNKDKDTISLSQFFKYTGMLTRNICRAIKKLELKKVICVEKGNFGRCNTYSINLNTEEWIKKVPQILQIENTLNRESKYSKQRIQILYLENPNTLNGESYIQKKTLQKKILQNNLPQNNTSENSSVINERKNMIDNTKYSEEFLTAYAIYPKRNNYHNKRDAYRQWNARLKGGATTEEMIRGIVGYQKYCTEENIIGTKFVKTMCVFLGASLHFGDYINYKPEISNATNQQNNKKSTTAERTESFARVRSKAMSDGFEKLAEATRKAEESRRAYEEARRACTEGGDQIIDDSDAR